MERRDVLELGMAASVGGSGCAALLGNPGAVSAGGHATGVTIGALVGITGIICVIVGLILLAAGK